MRISDWSSDVCSSDLAGGRLLVFAQKIESGAEPQEAVDTSPFDPTGTAIAALEVKNLAPGTTALVGTEVDAFPTAWSKLHPGTYRFAAVLDRHPDSNRSEEHRVGKEDVSTRR